MTVVKLHHLEMSLIWKDNQCLISDGFRLEFVVISMTCVLRQPDSTFFSLLLFLDE